MEIRLAQFSVVLVGKVHNPTILNPDFLAINEIVPQEWGWEVGQAISIPPFAAVQYQNGVSVTVENEKLQVIDLRVGEDPNESKVVAIATKYVITLPHVHYAAVGINFQAIADDANPAGMLKDRFLKDGPWDTADHPVDAVGVRLAYSLPGGRLVVSLDVGQVKCEEGNDAETKDVIIANGNFHRDCEGYPADEQVVDHLTHVSDDWSRYSDLLIRTLKA